MKFRLSCIFESPENRTVHHASPSVDARVQAIKKHGLCVAFSEVPDTAQIDTLSTVLLHHKIIAFFFDQVTVIPFRFDTVLEDLSDLELLLKEKNDYFKQTLKRLDGCAEMGIRAIVGEDDEEPVSDACGDRHSPDTSNPGLSYLHSRKTHYTGESRMVERKEHIGRKFRTAFAGTFRDFRSDVSRLDVGPDDRRSFLISLYFLIPKESLMSFRHQFAALAAMDSAKLLLSGPWPPYNFVLPGEPRLR